MKNRPWIWIIVAKVVFIFFIATLVTIAVRNKQPDVRSAVTHGH